MKIDTQDDNKYGVMLGIIAVVIFAIVSAYCVASQNQMANYVQHTIAQNTDSISNSLDAYVSSATNSIKLVSCMVTLNTSTPSEEEISSALAQLLEQTPFDFIEYINAEGLNFTTQGEWFDASDREYYIEGIQGNTGIWINYSPKYSEEYLLNFYTPLYYDGQIEGVLTGAFCADTYLLRFLKNDFFGEDMYGVLCDENGLVISSIFDTQEGAYLEDILALYDVSQEEQQIFFQQFEAADGEVFRQTLSSEGELAACITKSEQTGWRVVLIASPKLIRSVMNKKTVNAYLILSTIGLVLFPVLIYIRLDMKKRHRKQLEEKDRVVKNYEQILTLIASETYKSVRRVDLETGQTDYIYYENGQVHQVDIGEWMPWLNRQESNVHPDDYKRLKIFLNIDNFRSMQEGCTFQESYRASDKNEYGYYNTYFSTVYVTSIDGSRVALIATIDNTKAIMKEIEQKRWLASAASIYISMHAINLKENTWEVLKSTEKITKVVGAGKDNVANRLKHATQELAEQQWQNAVKKFINLETLDERMKGVHTITLEFVGVATGWCRARFIAVDYDEEQHLNRALLVIENIDAEKKNANRLQYLSETDLMTEIRNRGAGEKEIRKLIDENQSGMFCLLDVDKFKNINDSFGHSVGDKVLIEIARCLKESFSDTDVVMRLGGDEFAVFARDITTEDEAKTSMKRVFEKIDHIAITELGAYKIFVSAGVVLSFENDNCDFETMYHNADLCAYESKKHFGNDFTIYA